MKKHNLIILIIVIILGLAFCWYSYRPSKIREQCMAEAELNIQVVNTFNESERQQLISTHYKNCVNRFGLEK